MTEMVPVYKNAKIARNLKGTQKYSWFTWKKLHIKSIFTAFGLERTQVEDEAVSPLCTFTLMSQPICCVKKPWINRYVTDAATYHKSAEVKVRRKKDTELTGQLLNDRFRFWMTTWNVEDDKIERMDVVYVIDWFIDQWDSCLMWCCNSDELICCVVTMLVLTFKA